MKPAPFESHRARSLEEALDVQQYPVAFGAGSCDPLTRSCLDITHPIRVDLGAQRGRDRLVARLRRFIDVNGAPGVGKSTTRGYVAGRTVPAAYVPMDGFHLADVELRALGRRTARARRTPSTRWGYAALLRRLRAEPHPSTRPASSATSSSRSPAPCVPPRGGGWSSPRATTCCWTGPSGAPCGPQLDEVWFARDRRRRACGARWSRGTWQFGKTRPRPRPGWPGRRGQRGAGHGDDGPGGSGDRDRLRSVSRRTGRSACTAELSNFVKKRS